MTRSSVKCFLSNITIEPDDALSIDVNGTMKTVHTLLLHSWAEKCRSPDTTMADAVGLLASDGNKESKLLFISHEFSLAITETILQNSPRFFTYFKVLIAWALNLDSRYALEMITNGANSCKYLLVTEDRFGVEVVFNLLTTCLSLIFTKKVFLDIIEDLDSQKPSTSRLGIAENIITRFIVTGYATDFIY